MVPPVRSCFSRCASFFARILEEHFAANQVEGGEQIDEHDSRENCNGCGVLFPEKLAIWDEELAFSHQEQPDRQQAGSRRK